MIIDESFTSFSFKKEEKEKNVKNRTDRFGHIRRKKTKGFDLAILIFGNMNKLARFMSI